MAGEMIGEMTGLSGIMTGLGRETVGFCGGSLHAETTVGAPWQQAVRQADAACTPLGQGVVQLDSARTPLQQTVAQSDSARAPLQQAVVQSDSARTPLQQAVARLHSDCSPLQQAVTRLDSASTPAEWQQVRARFERLSLADDSGWLPCYYLAFTDIELFFRTSDEKEQTLYLEEAGRCLDRLKEMTVENPAERSEIVTLQGYWHYARVAANASENGPRYAGLVLSCFGEALKLNPENPRALLLNASFRQRMAAAMRQTYESYQAEIDRAAALLEQPVTPPQFPHWGKRQMGY